MSYVCQIEENRKVTLRLAENEAEIDFVLVRKEHKYLLGNRKATVLDPSCVSMH